VGFFLDNYAHVKRLISDTVIQTEYSNVIIDLLRLFERSYRFNTIQHYKKRVCRCLRTTMILYPIILTPMILYPLFCNAYDLISDFSDTYDLISDFVDVYDLLSDFAYTYDLNSKSSLNCSLELSKFTYLLLRMNCPTFRLLLIISYDVFPYTYLE